jgi:hypothetical protein
VVCAVFRWSLRGGIMLAALHLHHKPWQVARIAAVFQVDEIVVYHVSHMFVSGA